MYYNECPNCGATLDPGEKCDCSLEQNEHIHIRRVQYATKAECLRKGSSLLYIITSISMYIPP